MKHFILMILAVVSMFVMPNNANASDGSSLKEGVYKGALTYVYMNGDKDPYSPIEAELTVNANGTINLYVDAFKIGKMPGTITIDAQKITVTDGSFKQDIDKAILFKMPLIPKKEFKANVDGSQTGNDLKFTVSSIDATYLGVSFKAVVTFEGTWNREAE